MHTLQGQQLVTGPHTQQAQYCQTRQFLAQTHPLIRRCRQPAKPSQRCAIVAAAAAAEEISTPATPDESDRSTWPSSIAKLRGVRGSPYKFRRVIDQIRGRSYDEALFLLDNLPYRACEEILTVLISAASNAKNNVGATKRNLVVEECFVDDAGMYKRFQPRAKGRPSPIHVKKSHITIKLLEYPEKLWK